MKKPKKNQKRTSNLKSGSWAETVSPNLNPRSSKRPILKDIFFGFIVCLFFFLVLEIGLRLFWQGPPQSNEDPFVGFSAIQPLFTEQNGTVTISKNRLRYFNETSFSSVKPKHTYRIFAFGGSTTYGHPFNWQTSFPRWLQELLNSCENGIRYEVINLGGISYASYRIIPLMKESLSYQPDLFIVYTGQNEFLERRSYSGLIERSSLLLSIEATLEKLRLYQALKNILNRQAKSSSNSKVDDKSSAPPSSTKTILQDEANAILDRSSGLDMYHRDDQFAQGVVNHFRHNLKALITLSESSGIPIMFVSPASNLRDFSPFKSEHDPTLSARDKTNLDKKLDEADKLVKSGNFQDALDRMARIFPKTSGHAQANFTMAKALDGAGRDAEAREYFIRARDLDVCPLRATSPIETEVYAVTGARKTPLVDFRKHVEDDAILNGIQSGLAGSESFLDHVHPTVALHQKLAELIMAKMLESGMIKNCRNLSREMVENLFNNAMESLGKDIFVMRDLNLAKTLKWAGKKDEAKAALHRILEAEEKNPEIHKMLGAYALEDGQTKEAISRYKRAVELSGGDPQIKLSLATAYYRSGDKQSSKRIYETMISKNEAFPDIIANLSMLYLEENRIHDSLKLLEKSLDAYPDSTLFHAPYGLALAMSGDLEQGIRWMKKASTAEPGDPSHLYNLAGMYSLAADIVNCFKYLNLAIDRGYSNAEKLRKDPVFQSVRNSPDYYKALERISE